MNKQELMENYTMEQIAGMVVDLEKLAEGETVLINNKADEIRELKRKLDRKKTEINQIDNILNELFGVTHDVTKPDEFKKILKEKIENGKTIADFLPAEPIEAAAELINATFTRNKGEFEKVIGKTFGNTSETTIEQMYSISELQQIAEHLLIYCNANGGERYDYAERYP